jgi:outer membrane protein
MKKFMVIFLSLILICGNSGCLAKKELQIGFVDIKEIFDTFSETKEAKKLLEEEYQKLKKEIEDKEDEIEELQTKLASKVISETEKVKLKETLEEKLKEYEELRQTSQEKLQKKEKELLQQIEEKIYNAIKKVAKDKDIDLILDKSLILYGTEKLDLTETVIRILKEPAKK